MLVSTANTHGFYSILYRKKILKDKRIKGAFFMACRSEYLKPFLEVVMVTMWSKVKIECFE